MKKIIISATVALSVASISLLSADSLKNSLMPTASKAAPAVNLDNLNIDAKPASRPASAVVATVNGIAIKKSEADKFLALASKGRATDLDLLPKKQKEGLLKGYAVSVLIEHTATKEVPMMIKNKLAANYWAKQQMSKIDVSDKDAKAFYEKNKKMYKDKSGKTIDFDKVSQYIKVQLKQQKFNEKLIKNAKIVIK